MCAAPPGSGAATSASIARGSSRCAGRSAEQWGRSGVGAGSERCLTPVPPNGVRAVSDPTTPTSRPHLAHLRSILRISAPIFNAQIAVLANAVADTVITGHYHADHLA